MANRTATVTHLNLLAQSRRLHDGELTPHGPSLSSLDPVACCGIPLSAGAQAGDYGSCSLNTCAVSMSVVGLISSIGTSRSANPAVSAAAP